MRVAQMQRRRICRYSRVSAERSFVVTTRSSDAAIQVKNTQLHSTHVLPGRTSRSIARRDFLGMLSINQLQIYIAPYVVSESEALSYTYIILSPFIMAALCNRGAIIFLPCGFFLSMFYLSFFPRLISAATDRMSTILLHMAWP